MLFGLGRCKVNLSTGIVSSWLSRWWGGWGVNRAPVIALQVSPVATYRF